MRRVLNFIFIFVFTCFSFYYTDKVISLSKKNDPIMIRIAEIKDKEKSLAVNGVLTKDTMLVGSSGFVIDEDVSYEKMKRLNVFNESLLEYISVKPKILKTDNYDKLILGKNTENKEISLVFRTNDIMKIREIIYILNSNKISATFFIDGSIIKDNFIYFDDLFSFNINIGYFGYNYKYNEFSFIYLNKLYKNINNVSRYCLYINDDYLSVCSKYRINTIKPVFIKSDLYNYFKNNKKNGFIYEIDVNDFNVKQLNSTIIYLKQRGYNIININELLKE